MRYATGITGGVNKSLGLYTNMHIYPPTDLSQRGRGETWKDFVGVVFGQLTKQQSQKDEEEEDEDEEELCV